jgi:hypothetical protein
MAFYLTHATPTPDAGWVFNDETKVRLAGPEGPLARHILSLPGDSNGEWNLSSGELIALLPPAPHSGPETPLLLWDSGEPDTYPMRVLHFSGVSREFETELLVHMELLEPVNSHLRGTGRVTNEALRLMGGRLTPKARWVWSAPKMSIGSTIVGPASS